MQNGRSYRELKQEVIRRYGEVGPSAKSYVVSRFWLGHYNRFLDLVPPEGKVLDYGCGVGQLSCLLKLTDGRRAVFGYDYSEERMDVARKAVEGLPDTVFLHDEKLIPDGTWRTVIFYDMLHYMPHPEQDALVRKFAARVEPGGMLIIRDVNRSFGPRYLLNSTQERVMVRAGLTLSKITRNVYFRNLSDFRRLLSPMGFTSEIHRPPWYHPYADWLLIARKKS